MKKLILFLIPIFIAEFSFSQTDYRKGYVITNARDTLFGLVDYREGVKAYKSCDFKKLKEQNTITYEPSSIIGYGFENDKIFQSKEISIKDQPSRLVFFEVIVSGLVSLYKFEETYYVGKSDSDLQLLSNEIKEAFIDGRTVLKRTNQYIGTLNIFLFDCAEIRTKLQKVRLMGKELTNLIEDYNRCQGVPSITFKAKKPWTKLVVGVEGGLNISQLNFSTYPGYDHLAGVFEVSKSAMIGISLDVLSPRFSERISLHGDFLYLTSKYYNYSLFDNGFSAKRDYVTIELQQLKIPIGFRYTFPRRNFTPYLNIGISSTIHLSSNSKWIQEVEANSIVKTYNNEALSIKENQLGLWGGLGILKSINNKLNGFFELRYEKTDGISHNSFDIQADLKSKITNFQVIIGISTK
jgi:hypothetical protein